MGFMGIAFFYGQGIDVDSATQIDLASNSDSSSHRLAIILKSLASILIVDTLFFRFKVC